MGATGFGSLKIEYLLILCDSSTRNGLKSRMVVKETTTMPLHKSI
jgi:hypothetical protein